MNVRFDGEFLRKEQSWPNQVMSKACVVHVGIWCLLVKGSGEIKSCVNNQLHLEIVSLQMGVWSFSCGFLFSCANKLVGIQFRTGREVHPGVKGLILVEGEGIPLPKSREAVLLTHRRSGGTWSGTRKKLRARGRSCEGEGEAHKTHIVWARREGQPYKEERSAPLSRTWCWLVTGYCYWLLVIETMVTGD